MTTAKKEDTPTKAPTASVTKQELTVTATKDIKPGMETAPAAVVAPLIQADAARTALDDAVKGKIVELLSQPGANMTRIANDLGVSYGTVQSIKSKLAKPTPTARAPRVMTSKVAGQPVAEDVELMKLELDFLRRKVALLESRK
jgi:transposase-like protein